MTSPQNIELFSKQSCPRRIMKLVTAGQQAVKKRWKKLSGNQIGSDSTGHNYARQWMVLKLPAGPWAG